jgi:ParB family chromosome partitioning protein
MAKSRLKTPYDVSNFNLFPQSKRSSPPPVPPSEENEPPKEETRKPSLQADDIVLLPVELLVIHANIRKRIDEDAIKELAESIKKNTLLHPIRVFAKNGKYFIILGQRRFLACKLCGYEKIPAIVTDEPDAMQLVYMQAIENEQSENLHPEDVRKYINRLHYEFKQSEAEIAAKMGKSKTWVFSKLHFLQFTEKHGRIFEEKGIGLTERDALRLANVDPELIEKAVDMMIENPGKKTEILEKMQKISAKNKGTSKAPRKKKEALPISFGMEENFPPLDPDSSGNGENADSYVSEPLLGNAADTVSEDGVSKTVCKTIEMTFSIKVYENNKTYQFFPKNSGELTEMKLYELLKETVISYFKNKEYFIL